MNGFQILLKGYFLGATAGFGACLAQTPFICEGTRDVLNYWTFCAVGCALWPIVVPISLIR